MCKLSKICFFTSRGYKIYQANSARNSARAAGSHGCGADGCAATADGERAYSPRFRSPPRVPSARMLHTFSAHASRAPEGGRVEEGAFRRLATHKPARRLSAAIRITPMAARGGTDTLCRSRSPGMARAVKRRRGSIAQRTTQG